MAPLIIGIRQTCPGAPTRGYANLSAAQRAARQILGADDVVELTAAGRTWKAWTWLDIDHALAAAWSIHSHQENRLVA